MPHLYTYIYKLYLRIGVPIIPLIIKAPPPNRGGGCSGSEGRCP